MCIYACGLDKKAEKAFWDGLRSERVGNSDRLGKQRFFVWVGNQKQECHLWVCAIFLVLVYSEV